MTEPLTSTDSGTTYSPQMEKRRREGTTPQRNRTMSQKVQSLSIGGSSPSSPSPSTPGSNEQDQNKWEKSLRARQAELDKREQSMNQQDNEMAEIVSQILQNSQYLDSSTRSLILRLQELISPQDMMVRDTPETTLSPIPDLSSSSPPSSVSLNLNFDDEDQMFPDSIIQIRSTSSELELSSGKDKEVKRETEEEEEEAEAEAEKKEDQQSVVKRDRTEDLQVPLRFQEEEEQNPMNPPERLISSPESSSPMKSSVDFTNWLSEEVYIVDPLSSDSQSQRMQLISKKTILCRSSSSPPLPSPDSPPSISSVRPSHHQKKVSIDELFNDELLLCSPKQKAGLFEASAPPLSPSPSQLSSSLSPNPSPSTPSILSSILFSSTEDSNKTNSLQRSVRAITTADDLFGDSSLDKINNNGSSSSSNNNNNSGCSNSLPLLRSSSIDLKLNFMQSPIGSSSSSLLSFLAEDPDEEETKRKPLILDPKEAQKWRGKRSTTEIFDDSPETEEEKKIVPKLKRSSTAITINRPVTEQSRSMADLFEVSPTSGCTIRKNSPADIVVMNDYSRTSRFPSQVKESLSKVIEGLDSHLQPFRSLISYVEVQFLSLPTLLIPPNSLLSSSSTSSSISTSGDRKIGGILRRGKRVKTNESAPDQFPVKGWLFLFDDELVLCSSQIVISSFDLEHTWLMAPHSIPPLVTQFLATLISPTNGTPTTPITVGSDLVGADLVVLTPEFMIPFSVLMKEVVEELTAKFQTSLNIRLKKKRLLVSDQVRSMEFRLYKQRIKYSGEWKAARPHGRGKAEYEDSLETYEGSFSFGLRHGQGTLLKKTGERYEGSWKSDKRDGLGLLLFFSDLSLSF